MIHPHRIVRHLLVAGVVLTLLAPLAAAADFRESIRIGDERRSEEDPEGALAAYAEAQAAATADTDIAIALSKRASVKAYDQEKYDEAADLAAQALALTESHPVGHVTAYRVKALCEMKGDEDYEAAEKTLVRALALDDVDWAKPTLHLMLGDARRLNGQGSEALEAYEKVASDETLESAIRATAELNIGLTHQYVLRQPTAAREAYETAVELNDGLREEIDNHLGRL